MSLNLSAGYVSHLGEMSLLLLLLPFTHSELILQSVSVTLHMQLLEVLRVTVQGISHRRSDEGDSHQQDVHTLGCLFVKSRYQFVRMTSPWSFMVLCRLR